MKAVIQRVSECSVTVDGKEISQINKGFLVLLGVHNDDTDAEARLLAEKTAGLRVFSDENEKMNLSLLDISGEALVVSNFTLYADCSHGRRPSFINAARPEKAVPLYELYMSELKRNGVKNVRAGIFGADMKVLLLNDGPVTIILDTDDWRKK